jgi:hypothetical protein
MQHAASMTRPDESIFAVLSSAARKLGDVELGIIAVASGVVSLASVAAGSGSWVLLGACYVAWCFAGWGIVFRGDGRREAPLRALELLIIVSGTAVFAFLCVSAFFWSLGSHWQL